MVVSHRGSQSRSQWERIRYGLAVLHARLSEARTSRRNVGKARGGSILRPETDGGEKSIADAESKLVDQAAGNCGTSCQLKERRQQQFKDSARLHGNAFKEAGHRFKCRVGKG